MKANTNTTETQQAAPVGAVRFAAIDKVIESHIILPTEKEIRQNDYEMIEWGPGNIYPMYLIDLYRSAATLHSVVDGCVDYLSGNSVEFTEVGRALGFDKYVNGMKETPFTFVRNLGLDLFRIGGCAYQIIRDENGEPREFHWIDMRYLRTNKECDTFFYSEDFGKKYNRREKIIVYPKFIPGAKEVKDSIVFIKNTHGSVYPEPMYIAAVKACEIERCIDDFHLNSLENGFMSSYFINFNNGVPGEEQQEEIEKDLIQKFGGYQNAGRIGVAFNPDRVHAVTLDKMTVDDFGEKYKTLAQTSMRKIYTAFRANANLFGIPTESNGFNSEEYESAFKLFNRTVIQPMQRIIMDSIDRTLGVDNSIEITPFTL